MTTPLRILVTDGDQRATLAVVRSLGRAGHEVWVGAGPHRSIAGSSRYAAGPVFLPDPLGAPAEYADAVASAVRRLGCRMLLPVTEPALLTLLGARDRLTACIIPYPELATFSAVSDKLAVLGAARGLGIAVPAQFELTASGMSLPADATLRYPVVVKPSRSVREDHAQRRTKLSVRHAANASELELVLQELPTAAYPLLVQERIVGPGTGIFLLLWNGECLARFAHRRLREKPPSGGVSTYSESIPADSELVARSTALLRRFGWYGVAMVEYKLDTGTGVPYLMEVNGRFWGSLQLAIDAGVDFPALLVAAAVGDRPEPVTTYRVGARSRWWWGDVDHLLARIRHSDRELALPPDAPTRTAAIYNFLKPGGRCVRNDVLRLNDPLPFITESLRWLRDR